MTEKFPISSDYTTKMLIMCTLRNITFTSALSVLAYKVAHKK